MKKSIAIDMDNVIADVAKHYLDMYEKETGIRIPDSALQGVSELEALPDKSAIVRYLHTPGFFRTVPLVPGAQEALKKLQEHFEVYIVSAAMEFPLSLPEKKEWLTEYFPFISWKNIVFCGDKSIIGTDFMIDDHLKNLDYFKGKAFLFTAGHNIHVTKYPRLNNWKEAVEILLKEQ
jgi:5'-nucleotidase